MPELFPLQITTAETLGLAEHVIKRTVPARGPDLSRGIVAYEDPGLSFGVAGGGTVTVNLYAEDNAGAPRHRVKIVWTDSRDGGGTLHSQALLVKQIDGADKESRCRQILECAGIEVE